MQTRSESRRSRGAAVALAVLAGGAAIAVLAGGAAVALAVLGGDGAERSPAAVAAAPPARPADTGAATGAVGGDEGSRDAVARYRQDAAFEALAVAHARRWAAQADHPDAVAAGFSPARCGDDQAGAPVFLLPSTVGRPSDEPSAVTTDCTIAAGQRVLADLGGLIATEDANGIEGGYDLADGTRVPFAPEHLPAICADVLDQGLQPAPRAVTLDGEAVGGVRAVVSAVFRVPVAASSAMAGDAAALGHPDHVSAAYCGYKLLLGPLAPGEHALQATVMGNRTVTWRLQVLDAP
ncbi:MAG: hypothetical protein R2755_11100 [Acidimicrobiales bacterium]